MCLNHTFHAGMSSQHKDILHISECRYLETIIEESIAGSDVGTLSSAVSREKLTLQGLINELGNRSGSLFLRGSGFIL